MLLLLLEVWWGASWRWGAPGRRGTTPVHRGGAAQALNARATQTAGDCDLARVCSLLVAGLEVVLCVCWLVAQTPRVCRLWACANQAPGAPRAVTGVLTGVCSSEPRVTADGLVTFSFVASTATRHDVSAHVDAQRPEEPTQ